MLAGFKHHSSIYFEINNTRFTSHNLLLSIISNMKETQLSLHTNSTSPIRGCTEVVYGINHKLKSKEIYLKSQWEVPGIDRYVLVILVRQTLIAFNNLPACEAVM